MRVIIILLFVGLIALFPISLVAVEDDRNSKDKTLERLQDKAAREKILDDLITFEKEKGDLEKDLKSETDSNKKQEIQTKINEAKTKVDEIEKDLQNRDIPQPVLERLINDQELFEAKLLNSKVLEFVTSVGIDIDSKEIQVGLNRDIVNKTNEDFVIDILKELMPETADWHIVYSNTAEFISCTQKKCTPVIGGNWIKVDGGPTCSYGFQAKKGNLWGFITAGHCAENRIDNLVRDFDGNILGVVREEKFGWGTSCDCAFIAAGNISLTDNKIFVKLINPTMPSQTITKTTQAAQQQNDRIVKSGQASGSTPGIVSAINVSVLDSFEREFAKNLVRSNVHVAHGDSGGPVVSRDDAGNLYGIIVTHDFWGKYHVPIDQITAHMRVSPILN